MIYLQGQYARARPVLEERLRIWRELDNPHGVAWGLSALGYVALRQNDWQQATARFVESLALWRDLGETDGMATCLAGLVVASMISRALANCIHQNLAWMRDAVPTHGPRVRFGVLIRAIFEVEFAIVRAEII